MKLSNLILTCLITVFTLLSGCAQESIAQIYNPVSYGYYINGIYTGWGWYPLYAGYWPWVYFGYPAYDPYGYSYYSYFDYQPRYASFGSISYSPSTNRVGLAWGYDSQASALYAADDFCAAADCSSVVWVQGGCAAVAKGTELDALSWGYHTTKSLAQSYAMRACQQRGSADCRIGAWVCSF